MAHALKHNFYRCQFSVVVDATSDDAEVQLLKAAALFELHRVDEARTQLEAMTARADVEAVLYARARLTYLDDRHDEALAAFQRLHEIGSGADRFRAQLGIANCLGALGQSEKALAAVRELEAAPPSGADEADRLSLDLLAGVAIARYTRDPAGAESRLALALRRAEKAHWLYFQQRALYYLADIALENGRVDEAKGIVRVLTALIDPEASVYFCHLVNRRFAQLDAVLPARFRLDSARCRAWIDGAWRPLHEKPLVFALLAALHERTAGLDKESIARKLWPEERYKPQVHDARIFDLVRRTRAEIERYANQPVSLLSGRDGYRLVTLESKT